VGVQSLTSGQAENLKYHCRVRHSMGAERLAPMAQQAFELDQFAADRDRMVERQIAGRGVSNRRRN
jgi:hypothetical protein